MLRRIPSLILILVVAHGLTAAALVRHSGSDCRKMGMQEMECCKSAHESCHQVESSADTLLCCASDTDEPGQTATTFTLRLPASDGAALNEAMIEPPMKMVNLWERGGATVNYLPNLQSSYIHNLSLLI
jgi:hypothetical protein